MFLTAMAANPLSANLTFNTIKQTIGWTDWAVAAFVPGMVSLIVVGLWIFGGVLNVDAVTAAILGLSILITGVVTWKECLAESVAWDTLTWFAALIAMAGYLNKYGLISWFSQTGVCLSLQFVGGIGLSWQISFGILVLLHFYSHYFFASGAAHIGAMLTAFLSVASALGTPPLFGAMVLAFLSNLMGASPTMALGLPQFSMAPTMCHWESGGVMGLSSQVSRQHNHLAWYRGLLMEDHWFVVIC
ncbi:hypothetical protein MRB53_012247 [Persea americana]|uniref:Uncharacterized protein n=1 Tax=Persea americana TaxID=3435 RepID=A0ACC2LX48_PERAE|nr:hypothetical protein MRB53_012247 [Persea americana]